MISSQQFTGKTDVVPILDSPLYQRPVIAGKFLFLSEEKFWIRGTTYGTFRHDLDSGGFPRPDVLESDFALMAASGFNTIRTYTVPPRSFLDAAQRHGLHVMVGLAWEQHICFLDDGAGSKAIEKKVRTEVQACAKHPAILCYSIGNEIPASVVRWHGKKQMERHLERLYRIAKDEDPTGLVTYVNYPTTEYLELPFLDLVCFNVYLESQEPLEAYLRRLHNISGDRPLVLAEIGLDSRRHGEQKQAKVLQWQVRTAFSEGCAGVFVFAWTDEWHRGGHDIEDWDFGLTDRDRRPKPALLAVKHAFTELPVTPKLQWPRISVVVCSYNGAHIIRDCMEGLKRLDYPNYEVIVVNDGSTDRTSDIAAEYGVRVITTKNRGLSSARNIGMDAATGEIIAYTDDDARPDPHWLTYLACTFMRTQHAAVGGPNIAPPGDGLIADCVANAPGGPIHVLLSDEEAEHLPGCNLAIRKTCLQSIGGFDPQFRAAGDDVDVCWRLQQKGLTLGFNPAAMVWHHRRNSVRRYWKQQKGYGKAEALLEKKWPEKYNILCSVSWFGRIYGKGFWSTGDTKNRIYHGTWGTAPFQSLYHRAPSYCGSLPQIPEWYYIILVLGLLSGLSIVWRPLIVAAPLLALAAGASILPAITNACRGSFSPTPASGSRRFKIKTLTAFLHLLQPLARFCGRLPHGLTPWRRQGIEGMAMPLPQRLTLWAERGRLSTEWLHALESALRAQCAVVIRGGHYDGWDLQIRNGTFGAVRLLMAVEEHGGGRQLVRIKLWPKASVLTITIPAILAGLSILAGLDHAWTASTILAGAGLLVALRTIQDCAAPTFLILQELALLDPQSPLRTSRPRRTPFFARDLEPDSDVSLNMSDS